MSEANKIDKIVSPGTDLGTDVAAYNPPEVTQAGLRRRPNNERSAS